MRLRGVCVRAVILTGESLNDSHCETNMGKDIENKLYCVLIHLTWKH